MKKHKINPLRHSIEFQKKESLHIKIKTERLIICSVTSKDEKDCIELLSDPTVMKKFATGVPFGEKEIKSCLTIWTDHWKNHNPFTVYAIFEKNATEFLGIIGIGQSTPGEPEPFYMIHHRFWKNGYGSEASDAIFQSLIPRLMLRGYKIGHAPLRKLVATARVDNPASQHMLLAAGFNEEDKVRKFGAWRYSYVLFSKRLENDYQNFFTRRDQRLHQREYIKMIDENVDVTVKEMTLSCFGKQINTVRARTMR